VLSIAYSYTGTELEVLILTVKKEEGFRDVGFVSDVTINWKLNILDGDEPINVNA
jgi:hypothetical protein